MQVGAQRQAVQLRGARARQHDRVDVRLGRQIEQVDMHPASHADHERRQEELERRPHSGERGRGRIGAVIRVDDGGGRAAICRHLQRPKTRTRDAVTTRFAEQLQLHPIRNRDEEPDCAGEEQVPHVSNRETVDARGGIERGADQKRTRATRATHQPSPSTGRGFARRRQWQHRPGGTVARARRAAVARERRSSEALIHAGRDGRIRGVLKSHDDMARARRLHRAALDTRPFTVVRGINARGDLVGRYVDAAAGNKERGYVFWRGFVPSHAD